MPQPDSLTTRQRQVVNKRLTLNLLIQGAAAHGHWKAHRLVSEQLQAINPILESTYDDMMLLSELSYWTCLLYTSPSPRDRTRSRMPSSA